MVDPGRPKDGGLAGGVPAGAGACARGAPSRRVVEVGGELTGPSRSVPLPRPARPGAPGARDRGGRCACGGDGRWAGFRDRRGRRFRARPCNRAVGGGSASSGRSSIGRASPVAPLTV
ncbi:hypothetical protein GCM10010350_33510 [Streptomyces galilaeus]|nr:hypothetical protein GCM10010350_33510 [Streptomyces galilaeus]